GAWSYDPSSGKVTQITKPAAGASGGAKLSTTASGRYGIQIGREAQPILRNGKTVPYSKTGGTATSDLTAAQAQNETARIDAGLNTMKTGVDPSGGKHPPITDRAAAMAELEAEGYFSSPVLKRMAMAR